jgi:hypothetical protein
MRMRRAVTVAVLAGVVASLATGCRGRVARRARPAARTAASQPGAPGSQPGSQAAPGPAWLFTRYVDRTELAFSLNVPEGWTTTGGIMRLAPRSDAGPAPHAAGKLDFAVGSDASGRAMIRWLPDSSFADGEAPTAPDMVLLTRVLPMARPGAQGVTVLERRDLPAVAAELRRMARGRDAFRAALLRVRYQEAGLEYEERLVTVVESLGGGRWGTRATITARAPRAELPGLQPIMAAVVQSMTTTAQWRLAELRGGSPAAEGRAAHGAARRTEGKILDHEQRTNAAINRAMLNVTTGHRAYVNPYTRKIESDTDQWQHRWEDPSRRVVFTDDYDYDPNRDRARRLAGFRRSDRAEPEL